jgi:hypothetical protein
MLVGAPAAHRELNGVRLADHDQPRSDQAPGQRGCHSRPPVIPDQRAAGCHPPLDLDQILERDRYPVKRPDRMPRADRLVGRLGGKPGRLGVNLDKGVQLGLPCADPLEQRIDKIDRREAASGDLRRQDMRRQQRQCSSV